MLIILRGIPLSGKSILSSIIKNHYGDFGVLSSDSFRTMIAGNPMYMGSSSTAFEMIGIGLSYRMKQRLPTIVDATSLKLSDVNKYISVAKDTQNPYLILSMTPPPDAELERRNIQRNKECGMFIPQHVIERMKLNYEKHTPYIVKEHGDNFVEVCSVDEAMSNVFNFYDKNKVVRSISYLGDVWVIGDVHGCYEEFDELCSIIREKTPTAPIYQLGDWIDRGPSLEKTYDVIKKYGVYTVLGNHESAFMRELTGVIQCRSKARSASHEEFSALPKEKRKEIYEFMKKTPLCVNVYQSYNVDDDPITLSHAPVKLLSGEYTSNLSDYCSSTDVITPQQFDGGVVIHGHMSWSYVDIEEQLKTTSPYINVDSGCVYGDGLIALNTKTKEVVKVKSRGIYAQKHDS